jgi:hypothetical protein
LNSTEEERSVAPENPDIEFTADVKARELRFDEVPDTEVHPPSQTERENLPEEVQPDVTYRNASVRLRIANEISIESPAVGKAERRSEEPGVGKAESPKTSNQEKQRLWKKEKK